VVSRKRAAQASEAAQTAYLVESAPQLRLEHDDDRDDDEEGRVAEQPAEQNEVELVGDHADDGQEDQADQNLCPLSAAQQPEQLVQRQRHNRDIDRFDPSEVVDDLKQLAVELLDRLAHVPDPNSSAISAICA